MQEKRGGAHFREPNVESPAAVDVELSLPIFLLLSIFYQCYAGLLLAALWVGTVGGQAQVSRKEKWRKC